MQNIEQGHRSEAGFAMGCSDFESDLPLPKHHVIVSFREKGYCWRIGPTDFASK